MADRFAIPDMRVALATRAFPTMVLWNRLEGRPRTHDFDRALAAEVRDALWMLTRQWQVGELRGDDAGSPVTVQAQVDRQPLTRLQLGRGPVAPVDPSVLLEAAVERRPLPMTREGVTISLDLRLMLGRQWLQLTSDIGYGDGFIAAYGFEMPDPARPEDAALCANLETWQAFTAVAGRRMDGWRFFEHLRVAGSQPYDGVAAVDPGDHTTLEERATEFKAWVAALIHVPVDDTDDAWTPDRLEYRFECAAGDDVGEQVFTAEEYYGGSLDWYHVDSVPSQGSLTPDVPPAPRAPDVIRQATLPVQATFAGMPSTRWWEMEDGRTNFGNVRPDTTDLAKLMLIEFGLVYANDWFVAPCTLPAGSAASVRGLVVTNTFGERLWIEPVNRATGEPWRRFALFAVTQEGPGAGAQESPLLLLPTVPLIQDGGVLEDVVMVRDETANMVWGIEHTVSLPSGDPVSGPTLGRATRAWHQHLLDARLALNPTDRRIVPSSAPVRYRVATSVPEEWIPFLPVHVPGDTRETQLQRGAMPRILDGDPDPPAKVRPETTILRPGLDQVPRLPYFVHEEEVPRAGAEVTARFRRARWRNGVVVVWRATEKSTGRGESSSGLAFDVLVQPQETR